MVARLQICVAHNFFHLAFPATGSAQRCCGQWQHFLRRTRGIGKKIMGEMNMQIHHVFMHLQTRSNKPMLMIDGHNLNQSHVVVQDVVEVITHRGYPKLTIPILFLDFSAGPAIPSPPLIQTSPANLSHQLLGAIGRNQIP